MKHSKWFPIVILALLISLLTPITAHADMAPPEQPPGANIVPGSAGTQVRMVAETVTLTVLAKPSAQHIGQAATVAVFTMRNLGSVEEKMEARFPLTFWNNASDGYFNYPEIPDIQILVDGKAVSTHRIEADFTNPGGGVAYRQAPWAAFDVTFPPGKDVIVTVKYTTNGYGYQPYFALRYILETGAGWNGTIGSADIIVKLPYQASEENVLLTEHTGFSETTARAQLVGNEARWHYEDFEPVPENNMTVSLVIPSYWQKILDGRAQTQKTPNDGEAWGQLGKAIKESIRATKNMREDQVGQALYSEAVQAYKKSVTLLPKDALWHYGFADLLWGHYYYANFGGTADVSGLSEIVEELRQSLALDPNNQNAKDLAESIAGDYPWAISRTDSGYDYLLLTATPTAAPEIATPLPEPSSTSEPVTLPTLTAVPATDAAPASPTKNPGQAPLPCGGTALLLPTLAGLLWLFSKRR